MKNLPKPPFASSRKFQMILLLFIPSLLPGCAGKDFIRPGTDTFTLGQTKYSQVVQQMGQPWSTGDALKNGKIVKTITYTYASASSEPLETGVVPARSMSFYFYNDILVGQAFLSSFKSDNSNFEETRLSEIIKGKTTRAEFIQLLGRPSATYIAPMVKETSGEAIGYTYQTTRKSGAFGLKFFIKMLQITFDDKDTVLDISYESTTT